MNLKKIRLENQKTQQEVANENNLSQNTYSNYENNKTDPDIKTLIKLAQYFHTTVDYLIGNETPYLIDKSQFTQTQLEIIKKIKNLSEEACKRVDAYIMGIMAGEEQRNILQNFKRGDYE